MGEINTCILGDLRMYTHVLEGIIVDIKIGLTEMGMWNGFVSG